MSDELKIAALLLLLDEANQKPLPQVMQDVALEWLAERDTTPVDADWLDGVMERWPEGWWVSVAPAFCVRIYQAPDQLYMNVVMSGTIKKQSPTRGDVLTALRLFGEKRK